MDLTWRTLDWDSQQFGIGVARLDLPQGVGSQEVQGALGQARSAGLRLVYGFAEADVPGLEDAKVEDKVTYARELTGELPQPGVSLEVWPVGQEASQALELLALISGSSSRFNDPRLPAEAFGALYRAWIRRSCRGELAFQVLVTGSLAEPSGLITLEDKGQGLAAIGLVAVAPEAHGQGLGTALVRGALVAMREAGYARAEVVTQGHNTGACRLYEKTGFRLSRRVAVYHFWL